MRHILMVISTGFGAVSFCIVLENRGGYVIDPVPGCDISWLSLSVIL